MILLKELRRIKLLKILEFSLIEEEKLRPTKFHH